MKSLNDFISVLIHLLIFFLLYGAKYFRARLYQLFEYVEKEIDSLYEENCECKHFIILDQFIIYVIGTNAYP